MCTQGFFLKFYSMMHPKEYLLQKYLSFFLKKHLQMCPLCDTITKRMRMFANVPSQAAATL